MVLMADNLETARSMRIFDNEFLPEIHVLYNYAYHFTHNEEDANDLVQETYMKAFKSIDSYQEGSNAKAWLFRILKNNFINEYRKKVSRPTSVEYEEVINFHEEEEDTPYSTYSDLRLEIFEHMMGDEVTKAINELPIDFREVILLCDIEGFSYEEISKIVEIPIGTVRSRLHRARNGLKERLRDYAKSLGFDK
jgi:RNA polymerase sigma-70 factor (ECF subfamily)